MKFLISSQKLRNLMTDSYNFGINNGWLEHFEELRDREILKLRKPKDSGGAEWIS